VESLEILSIKGFISGGLYLFLAVQVAQAGQIKLGFCHCVPYFSQAYYLLHSGVLCL